MRPFNNTTAVRSLDVKEVRAASEEPRAVDRPWTRLLMGAAACMLLALSGCATIPSKQYFVLNYLPVPPEKRIHAAPYPYVIRLKEFDIEEAYARPQVVYRQSPFQLRYYFYKVWAVKPTRMVSDLVAKHLSAVGLVSQISRRLDEERAPDYEVTGLIEGLEEYDSENTWFAHMALWIRMTRVSDGRLMYSRHFDHRKQVFGNSPENVVRELSSIMEFIMNQAVHDLDVVFAKEYGVSAAPAGQPAATDTAAIDTVAPAPAEKKE